MVRFAALLVSSLAISCGAAVADPAPVVSPVIETVNAAPVTAPTPPARPAAKPATAARKAPVAKKVARAAPAPRPVVYVAAPVQSQRIAYRAVQFPSVGTGF